nr:Rpn family recombination-promoting nuclease/putative transposase [Prevotella sp.]
MSKYIRFDWAMKRLLRNKANHVVLEGFLSVLLEQDIKIHQFLESEGNQTDANDKYNRVDIMCEDKDGRKMIIEVQNEREYGYFHRMLYGTSKAITEYMELGDGYEKVQKVYSINIVYFDLGQGTDYVY